jgi:hypothetical protein
VPVLENRLKPFASNDIQQGQRETFRLFGSSLQLRDVSRCEVEIGVPKPED